MRKAIVFEDVYKGNYTKWQEFVTNPKPEYSRYYDDEDVVFRQVGGQSDGKLKVYSYQSDRFQEWAKTHVVPIWEHWPVVGGQKKGPQKRQ